MRKLHAFTLAAASVALLSFGANAQTVSGGDTYSQGFAAGAATQQQNSFSAFETGKQLGQAQAATGQAYQDGYAAGKAQASAETTNAFNSGYHARAVEETDTANKAFDNGFRAGATEQAHIDDHLDKFP